MAKYWSFSISPFIEYFFDLKKFHLNLFRIDWSPCSPRDSQESSPTPQFKSINFSVLRFLYSPTLTSIHDHWKNHGLDQMDYIYIYIKAMTTHASTLAWKTPWMEEPSGLQSMGLRRVRCNWATSLSLLTFMHWRGKWQPTPVFLPGESQGWRSLVGCQL